MSAPPADRRRPLRFLLLAAAAVALLAAAGIGTYVWALNHWFVGVDTAGDSEQVAVFRGLNTSIVGLELYRLEEQTSLAVADLTSAARSRVRRGITADDAGHAQRILDALRDQRLPLCPTSQPRPGDGAATSPASPSSAAPAQAATGTTTPPAPAPTATPPATTPRPSPSESAEPGVDCREAE